MRSLASLAGLCSVQRTAKLPLIPSLMTKSIMAGEWAVKGQFLNKNGCYGSIQHAFWIRVSLPSDMACAHAIFRTYTVGYGSGW